MLLPELLVTRLDLLELRLLLSMLPLLFFIGLRGPGLDVADLTVFLGFVMISSSESSSSGGQRWLMQERRNSAT